MNILFPKGMAPFKNSNTGKLETELFAECYIKQEQPDVDCTSTIEEDIKHQRNEQPNEAASFHNNEKFRYEEIPEAKHEWEMYSTTPFDISADHFETKPRELELLLREEMEVKVESENMWSLDDAKQAEAALEYFYSLPDNEIDSESDGDEEAAQELLHLELNSSDISGCSTPITYVQQTPVINTYDAIVPTEPPLLLQFFGSEESGEGSEDESWSQNTDYFDELLLDFERKPHSIQDFDEQATEIEYFQSILSNGILQIIVDETNLYAAQVVRKNNVNMDPGPSNNWEDTSIDEIKALIGMLIIMGIHSLPQLSNYWSTDSYLGVSAVSQVMSSKRYKKLIENIHLNDNRTAAVKGEPGYDKLHKVRPLINQLNAAFQSVYEHSSYLSVDESMISFKGRSSIRQYMPIKPVKRGYKVWCLADSLTGYIYKFEIYTGKSNNVCGAETLGEKVVLSLTTSLKNKNCVVAFDNFFTSVNLMKKLITDNIYAVGTVQPHRKGLPDIYKNKTKLKRGEFMFQTKNKVAAVKWMDNKPVYFLSNFVSPKDITTVKRKQKGGTSENVSCPRVVEIYNQIMGGVDKFNQLHERYAIGRRSIKWWHRIMYYCLDMVIVNSHLLMNQNQCKSTDHLTFRINLARQLISGFTSRKRSYKPVSFLGNKRTVPNEIRLAHVGRHMPSEQKNYRRCRLCSTKAAEKRTRYICSYCNVPLCVNPCFIKFHGQ